MIEAVIFVNYGTREIRVRDDISFRDCRCLEEDWLDRRDRILNHIQAQRDIKYLRELISYELEIFMSRPSTNMLRRVSVGESGTAFYPQPTDDLR